MVRLTTKQIVRQSAPVICGVLFISLITGSRLDAAFDLIIIDHPVLLILIPAYINITGDMSDVLSSRLSSYLYKGELDTSFRPFRLFVVNFISMIAIALTGFLLAAIFGNLVAGFIFHKSSPWGPLLLTVGLSGFLASSFISLMMSVVLRFIYVRGLDPDSIIPSISTSTGDLTGTLLLLFFASRLLT